MPCAHKATGGWQARGEDGVGRGHNPKGWREGTRRALSLHDSVAAWLGETGFALLAATMIWYSMPIWRMLGSIDGGLISRLRRWERERFCLRSACLRLPAWC